MLKKNYLVEINIEELDRDIDMFILKNNTTPYLIMNNETLKLIGIHIDRDWNSFLAYYKGSRCIENNSLELGVIELR